MSDDGRSKAERQRCPCGGATEERVSVKRPDGSMYITEFVKCSRCSAMFHRPIESEATAAAKPHPAPGPGFGAAFRWPSSDHQISAEELAAVNAAADRARKSRKRR